MVFARSSASRSRGTDPSALKPLRRRADPVIVGRTLPLIPPTGVAAGPIRHQIQPLLRRSQENRSLPRKLPFADLLRSTRLQRGLSVSEVADRVGVSTSAVYFWESDRVRPRDENLSALCKVLKLPIRATRELAA
jgi:DNA-binding XRE family transcriptional regulator